MDDVEKNTTDIIGNRPTERIWKIQARHNQKNHLLLRCTEKERYIYIMRKLFFSFNNERRRTERRKTEQS